MSESSSVRGKKDFFLNQIFVFLLENTLADEIKSDDTENDAQTYSSTPSSLDMVFVNKC